MNRIGDLELECQTLEITARDQRLVMYTAVPGTPSHGRLQALAAAV